MRDTSFACLLDLGLKSQSRATRSHSVPGDESSTSFTKTSSAALEIMQHVSFQWNRSPTHLPVSCFPIICKVIITITQSKVIFQSSFQAFKLWKGQWDPWELRGAKSKVGVYVLGLTEKGNLNLIECTRLRQVGFIKNQLYRCITWVCNVQTWQSAHNLITHILNSAYSINQKIHNTMAEHV